MACNSPKNDCRRLDKLELLMAAEEGSCEYEGDAVAKEYGRYRYGSLRKMWEHTQEDTQATWPLVKNMYICCPSLIDPQ